MTLFAIFAAIPPAAIPLSIFTTDNPNEQLCNIDAKAAIPFSPYPYPTDVGIPIIGIPTSVGYGYGEKGIAALASMLQSCSLGLSVVNIDNGIAAGGIAANIANRVNKKMIS